MAAAEKQLREEMAKLQVEINEEKSRNVDLSHGESFGFLGQRFHGSNHIRQPRRAYGTRCG